MEQGHKGRSWKFVFGYGVFKTASKAGCVTHHGGGFSLAHLLSGRGFRPRYFSLSPQYLILTIAMFLGVPAIAGAAVLEINKAEWKNKNSELRVDVNGEQFSRNTVVVVSNADTGDELFFATPRIDDGEFKLRFNRTFDLTSEVPCRIGVAASGVSIVSDVQNAPVDCDKGPPPEAKLEIKKAEWKDRNSELRVDVDGEQFPPATVVAISNADTGEELFSATPEIEDGEFTLKFNRTFRLTRDVPCRIGVDAAGISATRDVRAAPDDCMGASPEPNLPPLADAGDTQVLTLEPGATTIVFTLDGSGSHDPDGTIAAYEWSGTPNPNDVVSPQVTLSPGSFTFTLVATDNRGAQSEPSSVLILVREAPSLNLPPVADAGDDRVLTLMPGATTIVVMLDGSRSFDPDGSITGYEWTGTPKPGNVVSPQVTLGAGLYTFTLVVGDNAGPTLSEPSSVSVTVREFVAETPHAGLTFANYKGSETCRACHQQQTEEAHDSVHYQWKGMTPHAFFRDAAGQLVNMGVAGKLGGINDFCGYPDINFIGILTTVDGREVSGGCAQCHTGGGDKPDFNIAASLADVTRDQGDNIDCLVCHSDMYERKVARVTQGDGVVRMAFVPDPDAIPGGLDQAIGDIRKTPSVASCVGCHAYAGGGCNSKRGDIQLIHANPPSADFDVHMAPTALGGAGLHCLDCHVSSAHKIAGRGVDLRPTDLDQTVACTNCHATQPHNTAQLNRHTARVDCRSCHIPSFAKGGTPDADTDVFRDFRQPPELNQAKGLYEPFQVAETNVIPVLKFFNGDSEFYRFGDPVHPQANGSVLMAGPLGAVNNPGAKLVPLKHHGAYQPVDLVNNAILPLKMGILFSGRVGGSLLPPQNIVPAAILQGAAEVPQFAHVQNADDYGFIPTERYMGISHEVEPASNALQCDACHNGQGARIDFASLGYTPLDARNPDVATNCGSGCHGDRSGDFSPDTFFTQLHKKHVEDKRINCSACHGFAAAQ